MLLAILIVLIFLLFPLGQLERIPLANPQIGVYVHDLIIAGLIIYWLLKKSFNREKIKFGNFGKTILGFFIIAFFSFLINIPNKKPEEILVASFYLWRWGSYASLYFILVDQGIKKIYDSSIRQWLILVGSVGAFFGLLQYSFYPNIRPLTIFEWDPHSYRVVGTFLEPGFAGLIFVLTMILLVTQYWSKKIKIKFTIYYLLFTICYLAFALTYSRSAYLAYLIAMGIIAFFKKSLKFFAAVLIVFILTIILLPRPTGEGVKLERKASIWSRIESWQQGLTIFKEKPLLGVGFNFYRYAARDAGFLDKKRWSYSHAGAGLDNSFLFILATTGIIGLFFYSNLFYKIFKISLKNLEEKPFYLGMIASLSGLVVHSLFNNSLFYAWVMLWFWFLLAAYGE